MGSNTVHVLVAEVEPGAVRDLAHYVEMPELGAEVRRSGRIGERTPAAVAAIESVLARARGHNYRHLVAGATEAVRRAADRRAFLARASAAAGVPVRLIAPRREAELSFAGAAVSHGGRVWAMADVGGASTELARGRERVLEAWVSLPLGSGDLAGRHLADPPGPGQREALRAEVRTALKGADGLRAERLVATGGTASNLPLLLGCRELEPRLTDGDLGRAVALLDSAPASRLASATGLSGARITALRGGVEVLRLLLERWRMTALEVSHAGLRQGMLLAFLERGEDWWH